LISEFGFEKMPEAICRHFSFSIWQSMKLNSKALCQSVNHQMVRN